VNYSTCAKKRSVRQRDNMDKGKIRSVEHAFSTTHAQIPRFDNDKELIKFIEELEFCGWRYNWTKDAHYKG